MKARKNVQERSKMRALMLSLSLMGILTGCLESPSSSSPSNAVAVRTVEDEAPAQPSPSPQPAPAPQPQPWSAPATEAAAEQELRGTYAEQNKPANTITIDGSRVQTGSRETRYWYLLNGIQIYKNTTCTWTGTQVRAVDRGDGSYNFMMTLTQWTHDANSTTEDCMKKPMQQGVTEVAMIVRFIDSSCVGVKLGLSTGEKIYCK